MLPWPVRMPHILQGCFNPSCPPDFLTPCCQPERILPPGTHTRIVIHLSLWGHQAGDMALASFCSPCCRPLGSLRQQDYTECNESEKQQNQLHRFDPGISAPYGNEMYSVRSRSLNTTTISCRVCSAWTPNSQPCVVRFWFKESQAQTFNFDNFPYGG